MTDNTSRAEGKPPHLDRLSKLWRRIAERKIAQWSIAYVALAYAIQHGVVLTGEAFEWPHAVQQISMLLLALGLPVVMVCAWYHGERATRHISGPELTIITLLLVIGSMLFYVVVRPSEHVATANTSRPGGEPAPNTAADPHGAISLAVLPFVNLSDDRAQEFFSDGMTEEITSALAKIPNLRVVARTSAFEFKGQNRDVQAIAQSLHATHVIEGSVRKDGNEVRITAQLIKADDGTHLWTESYNRELKGVFAVQEEIASSIAGALQVPLGLKQGETLVSNRTGDVESYQQYLRAKALYRARALDEAIALLESAVALDPNYAPAWAVLAQAHALSPGYLNFWSGPVEEVRPKVQSSFDKADRAARAAIRLDPRRPGGYVALGFIQSQRGNWMAADDLFRQALALDSGDPDALQIYGLMLASVGRVKQTLSIREQLRALEPFVPVYNIFYASAMQLNGLSKATIPFLESIPSGGAVNFFRNIFLANAYAEAGRFDAAADALLAISENTIAVSRRSVEDAARLLHSVPTKARAPGALPALEALGFAYGYTGATDRLMEAPEHLLEVGYPGYFPAWVFWEPLNASVRKTERFKAYVRKAGMVDYWRARGWPEFCHPTTADDFACE